MSDLDDEAKAKAAGQRYLLMLLGVFFVGAAFYVWSGAWHDYRLAHADATTGCTVLDGDIDQSTDSKDHTTYALRLHVAYEVDGKRYEATDTTGYSRDNSGPVGQLQTYKLRGSVPCYYVKSSPDLVAVFPRTTSSYVTPFIWGIVLVLIPVVPILFPGKPKRRRRRG